MTEWEQVVQEPAVLALIVLVLGVALGFLVGTLIKRVLRAVGVPEAVEGTPFERTAQNLGTSTVSIVARLVSWFIYGVAILAAVQVARLVDAELFWRRITRFVPNLFIAVFVLVIGFVVADKAELLTTERLRSVKLPEVNVLPKAVRYTVLYIATLVALDQVGVSTLALVILLGVYGFGLVFVGGLAFRHFLSSGTAGLYLLFKQPYAIGDEIRIGDHEGVVQEVELFVTHIENDGEEYIVPNETVLIDGVVRVRG